MKTRILTFALPVLLTFSCHHSAAIKNTKQTQKKVTEALKKAAKPVWGYRFVITGDFNGDGKTDTLTEHFYSALTHKETNKYSTGAPGYKAQVDSVNKKKVYCFLSSSNKRIKPLMIDTAQGEFGLEYLKNEGDLDGDGADEISYVINYADWSNVNSCNIMTFKKGKWRSLYTFEVRDWQFPELPDVSYQYNSVMWYKMAAHFNGDSDNKAAEKALEAFPGLIKKLTYNKVQIHHFDMDGKDTIYVDLRPGHHKKNDQSN